MVFFGSHQPSIFKPLTVCFRWEAERETEMDRKKKKTTDKTNKKSKYSKGDVVKYDCWYVAKELESFCIRREVHLVNNVTTYERLPVKLYRNLLLTYSGDELEKELKTICSQQNINQFGKGYQQRIASQEYLEQSPWVTLKIRKEFEERVTDTRTNSKDSRYVYQLFETKVLKFFINIKKIKNPNDWVSAQHSWGLALLNSNKTKVDKIWEDDKYVPSKKTILQITQIANQFIDYLKNTRPLEYPGITHLKPLTRSQLNDHEGNRKMNNENNSDDKPGYSIPDNDWNCLSELLQDKNFINEKLHGCDIYPFIKLCYDFGLRRSESLGLTVADVKEGCLSVARQVKGVTDGKPVLKITKGKEKRLVPYWYTGAQETYDTVSKINKNNCKIIHPDTLTEKFKIAVEQLYKQGKLAHNYETHDCRRTFITKSLRTYAVIDIARAVGHKSISTTLSYAREDRGLSEKVFKPKSVSTLEILKTG